MPVMLSNDNNVLYASWSDTGARVGDDGSLGTMNLCLTELE